MLVVGGCRLRDQKQPDTDAPPVGRPSIGDQDGIDTEDIPNNTWGSTLPQHHTLPQGLHVEHIHCKDTRVEEDHGCRHAL
jgi:hypothetical protein